MNPTSVGHSSGYTDRSTYRSYGEYCGSRQREKLLYLYQYPELQCLYNPWSDQLEPKIITPSSLPKKDEKQEETKKIVSKIKPTSIPSCPSLSPSFSPYPCWLSDKKK